MRAAASGAARFGLSWLAVVAASFLLIRLTPADPVEIFVSNANIRADAETIAAYRTAWGLDRPALLQFAGWLGDYVALDWGRSFATGRSVLEEFARRAPWSAAIGVGGLALATLSGFALGFAAARRPGGGMDMMSRALALFGQAVPAFAFGLILLWIFAVELRLFHPFSGDALERLALPMALVAFFSIGGVARVARAAFAEARDAPWHATALSKGLSPAWALWRHGRRHAALTVLSALAPELAWAIGGTAVAEIVFAAPGLSERVVEAAATRDYPVLQAYVAFVALWILSALSLFTYLRRRLDPRLAT